MPFDPQRYEPFWRNAWQERQTYRVENPKLGEQAEPKFYVLDMFPYPSGAGLHVGHPLGYIASDIYARYKRMNGFRVLHPMGYDSFGLPAEQYALDTGIHPAEATEKNIKRYREQFDLIGFSFDWSREVRTSDPQYYKWTQWAFNRMFGHYYDLKADKALPIGQLVEAFAKTGTAQVSAVCGHPHEFSAEEWLGFSRKQQSEILMDYRLAYRKIGYVNWCEALKTVLANDEVKDGVSERGGHPVEKRPMLQWYLRTTAYADRLLSSLDDLEWTDSLKTHQRNWIGRSAGAQLRFAIADKKDLFLEIYTTRPDTIFGCTFMVVAPEHPMLETLCSPDQREEVEAYQKAVASRSNVERQSEVKTVSGVFSGSYAIHPFTRERIPVWVADYVLMDYGTGAIMAVPSDDERDLRFARHFDIPVVAVVDRPEGSRPGDKDGVLINSQFLNGLSVQAAIERAIQELEHLELGKGKINYKLRDANFARQRYWGEPFPIVYDADGIPQTVSDESLPVKLPALDDFKPTADGHGPLARATEWVHEIDGVVRETDTMPAVAGSSWYFLRFMDPGNSEAFASREALDYWQNVDLYVGGTEHAVSHLLYARFWQKFLFDLGLVPTEEPFRKLINQGMIQGVVESLYLHKEDKYFASADLITPENRDAFAPIYVLVDYVSDYEFEDRPHWLSQEQIAQFKAWRPEYADTEFRFGSDKERFFTHSEVGKMSKSRYNVVNPDTVIERYGADCFRMYEMFLGPIEQHKPWSINGIEGVYKFLRRFYSLYYDDQDMLIVSGTVPTEKELKTLHSTIKKVREDIERFSMNTCISSFMICVNELKSLNTSSRAILEPLVRLIAPFAPFLSEQIWADLGHESSIHQSRMPEHEEKFLRESVIEYPVSVNGKKRAMASFAADTSPAEIEAVAKTLESIQPYLEGKAIKKVIVVPGRMINLVV